MSNQIIDPRQALALQFYKEPTSETFGNMSQSMIKAGYSPSYARKRTKSENKWITENLKSTIETIQASEKTLKDYAELKIDLSKKTDKSTIEKAKLKLDASKFILKTLAKQKYNDEKEQNKANVNINIVKYNDDIKITEAEITE